MAVFSLSPGTVGVLAGNGQRNSAAGGRNFFRAVLDGSFTGDGSSTESGIVLHLQGNRTHSTGVSGGVLEHESKAIVEAADQSTGHSAGAINQLKQSLIKVQHQTIAGSLLIAGDIHSQGNGITTVQSLCGSLGAESSTVGRKGGGCHSCDQQQAQTDGHQFFHFHFTS